MPYIEVKRRKLSEAQNTLLIKRLTEVASEITNIPQEFFMTTITELADTNFGIGGKTIDKYKNNDLNITYESATTSDIYAVFALSKEYLDKYGDIKNADYKKTLDSAFQKIQKNICEYNRIIVNGCPAGYYYFYKSDNRAELDELCVMPPFSVKEIIANVIGKCLSETSLPMTIYVYTKDTNAVEAYKKLGFDITASIHNSKYTMQSIHDRNSI